MNLRNFIILLLLAQGALRAQSTTTGYPSDQVISIPTADYDIRFSVAWIGDDYPQSSAPGRIELMRDGIVLGRVTASHYRDTGPSVLVTNGTVDNVSSTVDIFASNGSPGDGFLYGTWHLTGLAPGSYTVRAWTYHTTSRLYATTVMTDSSYEDSWSPQPPNRAPTITWNSPPASAGHGAGYLVSAHGHDDDGNLAQVNVWKNGQPFAFAGGGNGTDGDSGNSTSDSGPQTVTFTAQAVDATGATSPVVTHIVTIHAPVNAPPTVTLLGPATQTVTAGTTLTITARATDADGNLASHNLDIQRPAGDWNFQGGFATGEPFQGGPVGSGSDSTRTASFTFSDVGTYHVRAAANDGSGWYQSAAVTVTVVAPPPVQYQLSTSAGPGGSVAGAGTFSAGTVVAVSASPDALHDFAGWSGDAAGGSNPLTVVLDRNKTVQANFSPKVFSLVTSATTGGSVTAGGSYPYGTSVTIAAAPDSTHRFIGWNGDATGTAPSIVVTLTGPRSIQAVFADKIAQTLAFPSPGNRLVGAPAFALEGSSSSGLPVFYTVLTGPATVSGGTLTLTGPGAVTVQASQPGDAVYLPAPTVTLTFNSVATATLKYRRTGRTLLQDSTALGGAPFVIEKP